MGHKVVPYEKGGLLYLKYVKQGAYRGTTTYREVRALFGCIDLEPIGALSAARGVLRDVANANAGRMRSPIVRPIGRIEIFGDDHTEAAQRRLQDRGLVLFDTRDKPVLHVLNALIGDRTEESSLTRDVLDEAGVPDWIFFEIQEEFPGIRDTNIPYYIVIQSAPRGDGRLDWDWYSVVKPTPA